MLKTLPQDMRLRFLGRGDRILARFKKQSSLETYLHSVVDYYCINWCKRAQRARLRLVRFDERERSNAGRHHPRTAVSATIEEQTSNEVAGEPSDAIPLAGAALHAIVPVMARMRPHQKQIIRLRFEQAMEIREIAACLAISPSATYKRLYRAHGYPTDRLDTSP
jgi:RNA polymerase sigma factor (sigma-70 family)